MLAVATDEKGKTFNTGRNTVNLNMKPDTATRVRGSGFRMIQSLDLSPGRYTLRLALREGNTRKSGSVTLDLDVPDFSKTPLGMSDIAMTSAMSGVSDLCQHSSACTTRKPCWRGQSKSSAA